MPQLFPIAGITDEFSPDLETAARTMHEIGMTASELRVVFGKNIIDLTDEQLDEARRILTARGLKIVSIASPLLKCVLPDAPEVDDRFQQDIFASTHTFEDQPRLTRRAFDIAERMGARIIRVFSYWRTVDPAQVFDRVVAALKGLAEQASKHNLIVGLENEYACNISTAGETARVLAALDHPNLKVVWDPANAYVSGENPYPDGYRKLPVERIIHVHAKDCHMDAGKHTWGAFGKCDIDWKGQIRALAQDGYKGYISLETHWPGPGGDKLKGSTISGENLKAMVAA